MSFEHLINSFSGACKKLFPLIKAIINKPKIVVFHPKRVTPRKAYLMKAALQ